MQEVNITLDLQKYQANIIKRLWWGTLTFIGIRADKNNKDLYRMAASSSNKNRLQLTLKVQRHQNGQWAIKEESA